MIIQPKFRGFICTTAHPVGCELNVKDQINYVKSRGKFSGECFKRVLVIGCSTGYGLAARIAAAFGCGAATIGIYFDKPGTEGHTGTPGWYNNKAFEVQSKAEGLISASINGDAFSDQIKKQTIELIKDKMPQGTIDLVVYSLASPRRTDPVTGVTYNSVIKPIGKAYTSNTTDFHTGVVSQVTLEPATEKEISDTVAVMGGSDWKLWIDALHEENVLSKNALTIAFSYIGPEMTHPIYKDGTIGKAKEDLEKTAAEISKEYKGGNIKAIVSVNAGLVTQASSAIPVVPLYMALLFKIMKKKGTHEGCIEQMYRMFAERLNIACGKSWELIPQDSEGRIRLDDFEMELDVQAEVSELWNKATSENIYEISDLKGVREDFFKLFGFNRPDVDYKKDVEL
jgi:enoyl-[acyl-carrier protein] reductase/trans-2-enoyl-CoA reductase (NAD+)